MSYISYKYPDNSVRFERENSSAGSDVLSIALLGNPNCGKTTFFNALTGLNQRVGNWSGVTVEKYEGTIRYGGQNCSVVDLPGTYSLSPVSPDETVTSEFIKSRRADVIVNVISASALERGLFLAIQTLKLRLPTVVALTFMDELKKSEAAINTKALSELLGVPIVPIRYGEDFKPLLFNAVFSATPSTRHFPETAPYKLIEQIVTRVLYRGKAYTEKSFSADKALAGGRYAVPLFICAMAIIFAVTFGSFGSYLSQCVSFFISDILSPYIVQALTAAGAPFFIISLFADGIIPGVGSVISFIPQLAVFFFLISLLESSGYMARTAFIADGILARAGLSGQSVIPMIMGFGCTIPAVMSTRTIGSEKQRRMTVLLLPFMSCSAKLPVMLTLASAFFGRYAALVIICMYLLGIAGAAVSAVIFKATVFRREDSAFVLELPPYRIPSLKTAALSVNVRIRSFLSKAGTTLFALSMVLWFLQNFDASLSPCASLAESLLFKIGSAVAPVFAPLGFGTWQAAAALIAGLAAKEGVLSTLAVVFGFSLSSSPDDVALALSVFTPASAVSFLVFVLLYTPCIGAVATIRKELRSTKWAVFSVVWQFVFAYCTSFTVYGIVSLLGW